MQEISTYSEASRKWNGMVALLVQVLAVLSFGNVITLCPNEQSDGLFGSYAPSREFSP
jgi:hypothetical protein